MPKQAIGHLRFASAQFLFALVVTAGFCQHAAGHGFLLEPMSRQFRAYIYEAENYAHGEGRAGGPEVVSGGKYYPDAAGHGICGDVLGKTRWDTPGPSVATYAPGSTVDLKVLLSTNHNGLFEFRLCPLSATSEDQCTVLQRADGKGTKFFLPMIKVPSGGATFDDATPVVQDGFFSYSTMPHWTGTCVGRNECDAFKDQGVYTLPYKIPSDASGPYKLQWYYLTGNSCYPPCSPEAPIDPKTGTCNPFVYPTCGNTQIIHPYPEQFWTCSDVVISGDGAPAASAPTPQPVATLNKESYSAATPTPQPSATDSSVVTFAPYDQCGGKGSGCDKFFCIDAPWPNTRCPDGYLCGKVNDFWWKCETADIIAGAPKGQAAITRYQQCGGQGGYCSSYECLDTAWPGTYCPEGFTCERYNAFWWRCSKP